jgi:hypothetical protein
MEAIIFPARWNGRATSSLTARGGGLPRFNYLVFGQLRSLALIVIAIFAVVAFTSDF